MLIELKQGTSEWLDFRRSRIMASDAPVIMEVSKWTTPYQLFMDKAGFGEPKAVSDSMRKGIEIEGTARFEIEQLLNTTLSPAVIQHPEISWMGASLDGYNAKEKRVVEIKLANTEDHECASRGDVPVHYYPQLQHQMLVADVPRMYYYSYRATGSVLLEVKRDNDYCNRLLDAELKFWDRLKACDPPEMTDKDYVKRLDTEWKIAAQNALVAQENIKKWQDELEISKTVLESLADGKSCCGGGIKFARVTKKGNIDYKDVPVLKGIDLEPYRKSPTTYYRMTKDG